jgi:hypothetical protein
MILAAPITLTTSISYGSLGIIVCLLVIIGLLLRRLS